MKVIYLIWFVLSLPLRLLFIFLGSIMCFIYEVTIFSYFKGFESTKNEIIKIMTIKKLKKEERKK